MQDKKTASLSEYERFVLASLYRQAEEEGGCPLSATARERIREEFLASREKAAPAHRYYRRRHTGGDAEAAFQWKPSGPMRTIRKAGK
ncbi:TPA: hypothetical protein I8Y21_006057 [Klebsiella oxytoca]|uniref:Uncharacterized protein n=1 Tax=Klebsiella oxytoca TaxID=571 RepID=A0AAN5RH67_KLEOX|nr:hypothetical protein [Klebsiella oxytoca]